MTKRNQGNLSSEDGYRSDPMPALNFPSETMEQTPKEKILL